MKPKLLAALAALILFVMFILYLLYLPVFYDYHRAHYNISHNGMLSVFFAALILAVAFMVMIASLVTYLFAK